jgi:hypothetical protein
MYLVESVAKADIEVCGESGRVFGGATHDK